jgi:predicted RNA-binding Zn-ribbon protein involved in translation (DUF1610 family)
MAEEGWSMIEYTQYRYHCESCGVLRSLVLRPNDAAGPWACPACGEATRPVTHCRGKGISPMFGLSFTFRLDPDAATTRDWEDYYKRRKTKGVRHGAA